MNRIVRENYPVSGLPDDLRAELADVEHVRIVLEPLDRSQPALTLDELWALRRPPFKTAEQIVTEIRSERDDWDG